jgi:hypothetical protein
MPYTNPIRCWKRRTGRAKELRGSALTTRSIIRGGRERASPSLVDKQQTDSLCSWDEWVPEDRVLPPTDENYAQQQKLRELANPIPTPAPKKKGGIPDVKKGAGATGGEPAPKGVKRSRDHDLEKVRGSPPPLTPSSRATS